MDGIAANPGLCAVDKPVFSSSFDRIGSKSACQRFGYNRLRVLVSQLMQAGVDYYHIKAWLHYLFISYNLVF
jgi:hypothetical protein